VVEDREDDEVEPSENDAVDDALEVLASGLGTDVKLSVYSGVRGVSVSAELAGENISPGPTGAGVGGISRASDARLSEEELREQRLPGLFGTQESGVETAVER
jgi:hypothetical protein